MQQYNLFILLCLIALGLVLGACVPNKANTDLINIRVSEITAQQVQVDYRLDRAATQLRFSATPDNSRAQYWRSHSQEYALIHEDGVDVIRRKDGKTFTTVRFSVDVVDISLPKYYRPFSPLFNAENGLVLHSGQYFVCIDHCTTRSTTWKFDVKTDDQNIVYQQSKDRSAASWLDSSDGRPFYVGPNTPIEGHGLRAIIDSGLPVKLQNKLTVELPKIIKRLSEKLGERSTKPLVFATYNVGDPEQSGFQGSVLNDTVVMHWWGLNLEERLNDGDDLWFFVHEITHFYQHAGSAVDVDEVAWIHEGFAELMAADLLAQTNDSLNGYVQQRYRSAAMSCANGLKNTPLGKATQLKKFDLHYKCGLLAHRFITNNAKQNLTTFELWNRYRDEINRGNAPSKQTYLTVLKPLLTETDLRILETIVGTELAPKETIAEFLDAARF